MNNHQRYNDRIQFNGASAGRFVFVNGYLGAGKTTIISALAQLLIARAVRPAVITNDQAPGLVDTDTMRVTSVPVAEVTAGCFCCRFSDLIASADQLLAADPDVILCEAVGSCTDIVSTVLRPLRRFYGDAIDVAPLVVLVDAARARELLVEETSSELRYLREKQIAEADVVLLNKIDVAASLDEARALVSHLAPHAKSLEASALTGDGLDDLLAHVLGDAPFGQHPLQGLDYDTYARAEELLAWLNATAAIDGAVDLGAIVTAVADRAAAGGEAIHVKASAGAARAQLTRRGDAPFVVGMPPQSGTLHFNARVRCSADDLRRAFESAAWEQGLSIVDIRAFHPAYPVPEQRMESTP